MIETNGFASAPGENYSAYEGAFEGPEKLLEIWFSPSSERLHEHQNLSSPIELSDEQQDTNSSDDGSDPAEKSGRFSPHLRRRSYALDDDKRGLRVIPRPVLDKMLSLVKCTVLNVISNKDVDAYVLR
jgi:S-adenosylmethionine decarboxylase